MEDFAASYARGETPIPCVLCNEKVKFADLLDTAKDLGADALATGHYVRRADGEAGPELHRAADASRDQSYFLFRTTRGATCPSCAFRSATWKSATCARLRANLG